MTEKTVRDWMDLATKELKGRDPETLVWNTPEGIPVKPLYTAEDLDGIDHLGTPAGLRALPARSARDHVRRSALDDPPVRGVFHGGRFQRLLPQGARRRPAGCLGRLRISPPIAAMTATTPASRGTWARRCRHRQRRGHEDPLRRHPASGHFRLHDHERRGDPRSGELHRRRRGAGRAAGAAFGHHPDDILKEFMVRNTYIYPPEPSMRIIADIIEYTAQGDAALQLHLDLRLPHAGGRCDAGAGACLHAGRRARVCSRRAEEGPRRGRLRRAPVVLLLHRHELLHGGGQAARRAPAVGADHGGVRAEEAWLQHVAHPIARRRACRLPSRIPTTTSCARPSRPCRPALGGTQSLHTNSFDEAIALPTEFSARIARNTQLILQHETGVTKVVDPLAGSYYVRA